jgi:hypothetical protein
MTKFDLTGANITANKIHIGDIYNYASPQDFINRNSDLTFSHTERELVKIIFANTKSEQERQTILDSLKSINSGEEVDEEKAKSIFSAFKPLIKFLKDTGQKVGVNLTADYLKDFAINHNFSDLFHSFLPAS